MCARRRIQHTINRSLKLCDRSIIYVFYTFNEATDAHGRNLGSFDATIARVLDMLMKVAIFCKAEACLTESIADCAYSKYD